MLLLLVSRLVVPQLTDFFQEVYASKVYVPFSCLICFFSKQSFFRGATTHPYMMGPKGGNPKVGCPLFLRCAESPPRFSRKQVEYCFESAVSEKRTH